MKQLLNFMFLLAIGTLTLTTACNEDGGDDDGDATPQPVADFTIEADEENPLLYHFTDASVNAETYSWDFGDGGTSTEASPSHEFESTGGHNITLTVMNGELSSDATKSIEIESPGGVPTGPNVIVGSDMEDPSVWTVMSGQTDGNVPDYEFTEDGKLHFSGDAEVETLYQIHIWQEIELEADTDYLIYADVEGSGLDWGYLEIDIGTILPEENMEYQHPNIDALVGIDSTNSKVIGVNNFLGCGMEAFSGNIIEVGCDGPAQQPDPNDPDDQGTNGRIRVSFSGSYYFLIKAGVYDRTMGDGITIDNILLAPIIDE